MIMNDDNPVTDFYIRTPAHDFLRSFLLFVFIRIFFCFSVFFSGFIGKKNINIGYSPIDKNRPKLYSSNIVFISPEISISVNNFYNM